VCLSSVGWLRSSEPHNALTIQVKYWHTEDSLICADSSDAIYVLSALPDQVRNFVAYAIENGKKPAKVLARMEDTKRFRIADLKSISVSDDSEFVEIKSRSANEVFVAYSRDHAKQVCDQLGKYLQLDVKRCPETMFEASIAPAAYFGIAAVLGTIFTFLASAVVDDEAPRNGMAGAIKALGPIGTLILSTCVVLAAAVYWAYKIIQRTQKTVYYPSADS